MLSRAGFFQGSSEKFLKELSSMLEVDLFLPGQYIIQQGQDGDKMYFLNWGSVEVLLGEQVVGNITAGNVFGEMALFSNGKRSCTVRATDTCDCRSVDQHRFQRLLVAYPEERERFDKLMEGRLQETSRLRQESRKREEPPMGRLRAITLRSLSVIAKMSAPAVRKQTSDQPVVRKQTSDTPRAGRPATWPVAEEEVKAKASAVPSAAKRALAKLREASRLRFEEPRPTRKERRSCSVSTELDSREHVESVESIGSEELSPASEELPGEESPPALEDVLATLQGLSPASAAKSEVQLPEIKGPAPTLPLRKRQPKAQSAPSVSRRGSACHLPPPAARRASAQLRAARGALAALARVPQTGWPPPREPSKPKVNRRHSFQGVVPLATAAARLGASAPKDRPEPNDEPTPPEPSEPSEPPEPAESPEPAEPVRPYWPFAAEPLPPIHVFHLNPSLSPNSSRSEVGELTASSDTATEEADAEDLLEPESCFVMHMVRGKFQLGRAGPADYQVPNRAKVCVSQPQGGDTGGPGGGSQQPQVVNVTVSGTLSLSGPNAAASLEALRGLQLAHYLQQLMPSVGQTLNVNLDIRDDAGDASRLTSLYETMISQNQGFQVFVGPITRELSEVAASITSNNSKVLMLPFVSLQALQRSQSPTSVFSLEVPPYDLLKMPMWKAYQKGARTLALWEHQDEFYSLMCNGTADEAAALGMEVVLRHKGKTAEERLLVDVRHMAAISPDAVIICGDYKMGVEVMMAMDFIHFSPKAVVAWESQHADFSGTLLAASALNVLGSEVWSTRLEPCNLMLDSGCTTFTRADFFTSFKGLFGSDPTLLAAQAAAALLAATYLVPNAFQSSTTGDTLTALVTELLSGTGKESFYHPLVFDDFGFLTSALIESTQLEAMNLTEARRLQTQPQQQQQQQQQPQQQQQQQLPVEPLSAEALAAYTTLTPVLKGVHVTEEAGTYQPLYDIVYPRDPVEERKVVRYPCDLGFEVRTTSLLMMVDFAARNVSGALS
ncbi:unnamed protein product [Effrenium voratum]|nr:unnamed protein product [Effrenium voratum]